MGSHAAAPHNTSAVRPPVSHPTADHQSVVWANASGGTRRNRPKGSRVNSIKAANKRSVMRIPIKSIW